MLLTRHVRFYSSLPSIRVKSREACKHPFPELANDARLLMLLLMMMHVFY
jgi:hypothetical protein